MRIFIVALSFSSFFHRIVSVSINEYSLFIGKYFLAKYDYTGHVYHLSSVEPRQSCLFDALLIVNIYGILNPDLGETWAL